MTLVRRSYQKGKNAAGLDPTGDLFEEVNSDKVLPISNITFAELIRNTDRARIDRAQGPMTIKFKGTDVIKPVEHPVGFSGQRIVRYRAGQSGKLYHVAIHFFDYRKGLQSKAYVFCGCPDFKFRNEWLLADRYRATDKFQVEDRPPYITNPDMVPYLCKHLIRCIPRAFKQVKKFSRNPKYKKLRVQYPWNITPVDGGPEPSIYSTNAAGIPNTDLPVVNRNPEKFDRYMDELASKNKEYLSDIRRVSNIRKKR